jgi:hypothetical protein
MAVRTDLANRTHCPAGHPFDEKNTYWCPREGYRICRKCRAATQARHASRKREEVYAAGYATALAMLENPSDELVNAAARGAWHFQLPETEPSWEELNANTQEVYRIDARSVLRAAASALADASPLTLAGHIAAVEASGTHVVVPVEPTEEMWRAGDRHSDEPVSWIYRAMLIARPHRETTRPRPTKAKRPDPETGAR